VSQQPRDQERHHDDDAFRTHEAALRRSQAWDALANLYAGRVASRALADSPAERARLHERRGVLLELHLGDPAAAIEDYQRAAQLAPDDPAPLHRLRTLYQDRADHTMVLQIAEAELLRHSDPLQRAQLLEISAEIWESQFEDREQGQALRARAAAERGEPLEYDADEVQAESEAQIGENLQTADSVEGTRETTSPTQRAWLAAARGQSAEAVTLLRGALKVDPDDIEAIDMLITVLEGAERHAESAEWLERRATLAEEAETRAAVLKRLAVLREGLGDPVAARQTYEQALEAQPDLDGVRPALLRLYRETEAWADMRGALESWALEGSDRDRVEALVALGDLLEHQFEDLDAAAQSFRLALALRASEPRAREALKRLTAPPAPVAPEPVQPLAEEPPVVPEVVMVAAPAPEPPAPEPPAPEDERKRALRILGVLRRKLEGLEADEPSRSSETVQLRLRMAELQSKSLDDAQGAIATLEPLLDSDVGAESAATELAELYARIGRMESLSELAEGMAARADGPERTRWLHQAAEIARDAGRVDLAIRSLESILEETPNDPHAEQQLSDLYRDRGDAEPLVALLRRSLARAEGEREREIHIELATQLEGPLGDASGALVHLSRAVEQNPTDFELLDRGLALARLVGGELAQLDLLDRATTDTLEPQVRASLLARRASHMADQLGWDEEAATGWRMAQELDPECAEANDRLAKSPAR